MPQTGRLFLRFLNKSYFLKAGCIKQDELNPALFPFPFLCQAMEHNRNKGFWVRRKMLEVSSTDFASDWNGLWVPYAPTETTQPPAWQRLMMTDYCSTGVTEQLGDISSTSPQLSNKEQGSFSYACTGPGISSFNCSLDRSHIFKL